MKGKFSSETAARIYESFEPEETLSGLDNWFGLYRSDKPGGVVLREDELGFVTMEVYGSEEDLLIAWLDYQNRYEVDPDAEEPDDDDYVIDMKTMEVKGLPTLRDPRDYEDAILKINENMIKDNFYPDVWTLSDHGNFVKMTDFSEEVKRIQSEMEEGD